MLGEELVRFLRRLVLFTVGYGLVWSEFMSEFVRCLLE